MLNEKQVNPTCYLPCDIIDITVKLLGDWRDNSGVKNVALDAHTHVRAHTHVCMHEHKEEIRKCE